MQVDPVKSTLKALGTEQLKLEYDGLLSRFAFKFNLRRYTEDATLLETLATRDALRSAGAGGFRLNAVDETMLGMAVQLDPIKPTLKPPGPKLLKLKCD